jgi:hypothetical protein
MPEPALINGYDRNEALQYAIRRNFSVPERFKHTVKRCLFLHIPLKVLKYLSFVIFDYDTV